jgi:hypothetical protein
MPPEKGGIKSILMEARGQKTEYYAVYNKKAHDNHGLS